MAIANLIKFTTIVSIFIFIFIKYQSNTHIPKFDFGLKYGSSLVQFQSPVVV